MIDGRFVLAPEYSGDWPLMQVGGFGVSLTDAFSVNAAALPTGAAQALHAQNLGVDGSGLTIGILSDSFNTSGNADTMASDIANGYLPQNTQVLKDTAGGTDEGRGMAQIVHLIAPGAAILFETAYNTQAAFAANIRDLAAHGARIIVDDVSYFAEPAYQDGVIAQAVEDVIAQGVVYVSSAGNNASLGYEAAFTVGSAFSYSGFTWTADNFSAGNSFLPVTFSSPGRTVYVVLQWAQPAASASPGHGATSDLDLFLTNSTGSSLFAAATADNLGGDPVEVMGVSGLSGTYYLRVGLFSGAAPSDLKITVLSNGSGAAFNPSVTNNNRGTMYGHPAAAGALAVGAANYQRTPAFGFNPAVAESFSSAGPDYIYFGHAGDLLAQRIALGVDVTGVDGIDTSFFGSDSDGNGFPNFFGTSAAAPSVAAVVALMLQANPNLSPAQIGDLLAQTALAMANPDVTGAGLVQADRAVAAALALLPAAPSVAIMLQQDTGNSSSDRITAIAALSGSGDANATVTIREGGTTLGTTTANGSGLWSFAPSLGDGNHTVSASETNSGGTGNASLTFTLKTSAPAPSGLTLSPSTDSGNAGDNISNVTMPTITGSGEAGDTITLFDNATAIGSGTVGGNGAWSVTVGALAAGGHSLTARETDIAGNQSAASAALVLTIKASAPAPSGLTLSPSTDSGVVGDNITNVTMPTITGSGEAGDTITLFDGATAIGSGTVGGNGAWSVTASALAAGGHSLTATEMDVAGNASAASAALILTIKTSAAAPTGLTLSPLTDSDRPGDNVTNVTMPTIIGNAEAGGTVSLFDGGSRIAGATVAGSGDWSITATSALSVGAHVFTASETDIAGNVSGLSLSLTVTVVPTSALTFVTVANYIPGGQSDIVFRNGANLVLWPKSPEGFFQAGVDNATMGSEWTAFGGTGDFAGDGTTGIVWTKATGQVAIWLLDGAALRNFGIPDGQMGAEWQVAGVGDTGGDGKADIFWVSNAGAATVWTINGTTLAGLGTPDGHMGAEWRVAGLGDFNGDGRKDALWLSNSGDAAIWTLDGTRLIGFDGNAGHMGTEWHVAGIGRLNGDNSDDIVWVNTDNNVQIWNMNAGRIAQIVAPDGREGLEWYLKGVGDFDGSGSQDLLWLTGGGAAHVWQVSGTQVVVAQPATPPNATLLGL